MTPRRPSGTNWAGNVRFSARELRRPASITELQDLVAGSDRVRALGTGHSFSLLADTTGVLVSTAGLPRVTDIDRARRTVTVGGGVRYGELATRLHPAGLALPSMASLPHISVAGACATATHGSGNTAGNLATAVAAMELVTADGSLITLARDTDGEQFAGAVVSLGCLGVVTRLTLELVPAFEIAQYVCEDIAAAEVSRHFDEVFGSAYSVSVFTRWQAGRDVKVWLKHCPGAPGDPAPPPRGRSWLGGRPADGPRHPIPGLDPAAATGQLGVPGPWYERLPHFRLAFTPSSGDELQSEYLLPRAAAADTLAAAAGHGERLAPVLQVCEIRTVAADELWLSPSYRRDTVALHFTWIRDQGAVAPVLAGLERDLVPLGAGRTGGRCRASRRRPFGKCISACRISRRSPASMTRPGPSRTTSRRNSSPLPNGLVPGPARLIRRTWCAHPDVRACGGRRIGSGLGESPNVRRRRFLA
jgi:xylitol oxidase